MIKKFFIGVVFFASILNGQILELSATVISDNEKFITSRFMGFIQSVLVSEGDKLKKVKFFIR